MGEHINALIQEMGKAGSVEPQLISDGYHTFAELYDYRKAYNAAFFNELSKQGLYDVHKSERHSDGVPCFGGDWFVVCAELPTGQVTNHYMISDWGLFNIPTKERANKWDGHTAAEGLERLMKYVRKIQ